MATLDDRNVKSGPEGLWRVGDLARQSGVSVRTLHYYDQIGLLSPSRHTEGRHRLYTAGDIVRLQQIRSLQQMGFSLEEIRDCLESSEFSPHEVIALHLERLRGQIAAQQRLCDRLEKIAGRLQMAEEIPAGEFIQLVETMTMVEKYYTPEQMEEIRKRAGTVGQERIRQAEGEWQELMAKVSDEMRKGTDPADPRVQELASKWMSLVNEFTGGNPAIEKGARTMWEQEETIHGIDTGEMREMGAYIQKAMAASKRSE
jgi:DNA-binding transcriptional MerR regulator